MEPQLNWLAAAHVDRLVNRALDGLPSPAVWPHPPKAAGGTVEISVRHHSTVKVRTPVILTLQEENSRTGTAFSVVLGHTARIAMPGGRYFGAAMVVNPARRTLDGIGWSRLAVNAHRTSPLVIPAQRPSAQLIFQLGLRKADGTPLFRL
ncbi:hypothetical protein [Amycolatopsis sp. lyj-23]|uniref:hypothetical protein n=1 Tax=Amycolatopsis sp. lyj-23 TaxID=2789283 RepID=UPI0039784959